MMRQLIPLAAVAAAYSTFVGVALGQVPKTLHYQGNVSIENEPFNGTGHFKFALVNPGEDSLWSNDGTSNSGQEPNAAVLLNVVNGVFSIVLGDASLGGMEVLPVETFVSFHASLRVWFDDGSGSFEQLSPDQIITSTPYAMVAGSLAEGATITGDQLDPALGLWSMTGENLWTNDRVGIGITDPHDRLEVDGIIRATGGLRLPDGTLVTSFSEIQGLEGPQGSRT